MLAFPLLVSMASLLLEDTVPPAVSRPTPAEALARATEAVRAIVPEATVAPVRSKNPHLDDWKIERPLDGWHFHTAIVGQSFVAPLRKFVAVEPDGTVRYPFTGDDLAKLLAAHDKSDWKDEDYVNAAILHVHLTSVANEDGWKVLRKPEDFLAITFNMPKAGPAVAARAQAAERITAPAVARENAAIVVTLQAWHLIGGELKKWTVEFGENVAAKAEPLGQFGGGGYD
ncbi:MAG: hypothetical protein WD066_03920 [Planctomycetaceae bacterium]